MKTMYAACRRAAAHQHHMCSSALSNPHKTAVTKLYGRREDQGKTTGGL